MALNVFGKPIGNETLKAMPKYQYNEVITAVDRAYEALIMKNADNKDVKARKFVESLKKNYGASLVATLCFIYNAAGNRLTFVVSHDWEGHIGDCPYPLLLENGQWGAFLHVQTSPYRGSVAATIYRGQDESGDAFDWMLSWQNVWNDNNGVSKSNF
ncbi:23 kDa jasmonate-induced protein [Ziziphus jujuba]|uniref:23 kDa jasmonate-induced protein n=1 Tax=Ziziphus jujuba TaxID=326968 RepID=A0A6P4BF93_ZIZJJ|nr:23 kDa jasmonate-induced protein [Ziziphus jujuba]